MPLKAWLAPRQDKHNHSKQAGDRDAAGDPALRGFRERINQHDYNARNTNHEFRQNQPKVDVRCGQLKSEKIHYVDKNKTSY
jgi:hypothetical protein